MATKHIDQFADFHFYCFIHTNMTGRAIVIIPGISFK